MPYIKQTARAKFDETIGEVTTLIISSNVPRSSKVEFFGFYVSTLIRRYVQVNMNDLSPFNSYLFPEQFRQKLVTAGNKIATKIGAGDPLEAAGELNYAITSVLWRLLRENEFSSYGARAFLNGAIRKVLSDLAAPTTVDPKEKVMSSRRHIISLGVLNDVLDETYRRRTAEYEEQKIVENGDIDVQETA